MRIDRRAFLASSLLGGFQGVKSAFASGVENAVAEVMASRQGSAVVVNVKTGKLAAQYRLDSAAQRLVPPGSVIKPFVLAALIDANIVRPSTRYQCERTLRINGRNLDCAHVAVGEPLDPVSALAYSCNAYFARFASRLQPADFVRGLAAFGMTSSTKLAPSEVTGRITMPGDMSRLQLLALGEAGINVTPLEVVAGFRRLATIRQERNLRSQQLSLVFDGLSAAAEYGTARLAQPSSIRVAGKTGTATGEAGARTHAWFAGYAPADHPEFVVVIFLETGSGGGDAAPLAREIFAAL